MFDFFKKENNIKLTNKNNSKTTLDKVKELVIRVDNEIASKDIRSEVMLEDLGFDSIKFMNLFVSFEDVLEMDLEDIVEKTDLSTIQTVQDIVILLEELKENKI